ncbi:MAG: DNA mismatch repair protein MutS, partial [Planctomycetota bacterium]
MAETTPMMRQYDAAKKKAGNALLFFRMGDFYELFFDDARSAAQALGLTLTARDKEKQIPMAGVPVRAVDGYLRRLVSQGFRVAICEQLQDPAEAKGIVDRDVVRIVTPGTLTEESVLDARAHNYLLAVHLTPRRAGLAWAELSTGRFFVEDVERGALIDAIARVAPAEVLLSSGSVEQQEDLVAEIARLTGTVAQEVPDWVFGEANAQQALKSHFRVSTLEAFGLQRKDKSLGAAAAILHYLGETQRTALTHLTALKRFRGGDHLVLDAGTRRRLDLDQVREVL